MGGGRDTTKGIKTQSIICTLDSLKNQNWMELYVEPHDLHKVDFHWINKDGTQEVAQVKSTENDFAKSAMKEILDQLIIDFKDADKYYLYLVGTCLNDARKFVAAVNDKTIKPEEVEPKYSHLRSNIDKVKIIVRDFDYEALEGNVYKQIHKFYDAKGSRLSSVSIEQKAAALIHRFDTLPILKQILTRESLEVTLIEWIDHEKAINSSLKEKQEFKEKLENFQIKYLILKSSLPINFENSEEMISRLNQLEEHADVFEHTGFTKEYQKILRKLEEADSMKKLLNLKFSENGGRFRHGDLGLAFVNQLERWISDVLDSDEVKAFDNYLRQLISSVYSGN